MAVFQPEEAVHGAQSVIVLEEWLIQCSEVGETWIRLSLITSLLGPF